ncbi:MAG TPA: hypothetical protein VEI03_00595 [Stellaceae bacterium]|nr:hypothetical protein [Stellaceae bacterium]
MWIIENYREQVGGVWREIVKEEWMASIADPALGVDCASLCGWMKAVRSGAAEPTEEPAITALGQRLRYRAAGHAVMIFVLLDGPRLLILFVGRSASALPRVPD